MPPQQELVDVQPQSLSHEEPSKDHSSSSSQRRDDRYPLYLGKWKSSIPYEQSTFAQDHQDEPHLHRKRYILQKHPEITKLYGIEPLTKYAVVGIVLTQLSLAFIMKYMQFGWSVMLLTAYIVGATLTQNLGLLIHECAHELAFEGLWKNRLLALVANICIPFPIGVPFRRYHLLHHSFQGIPGHDADLPLEAEIPLIHGSMFKKMVWMFCYPIMYPLRGAFFGKKMTLWEGINLVYTICVDLLLYYVLGNWGFLYMICSVWLGYGIHPMAAHFIQEHYTFVDGQETYSYYGWMNKISFNVGYHVEHHDFIKIPWSRLPKVREIAPEFYDNLFYHTSWTSVLYQFLTSKKFGPQSRVVRTMDAHWDGRKFLSKENIINGQTPQQKKND